MSGMQLAAWVLKRRCLQAGGSGGEEEAEDEGAGRPHRRPGGRRAAMREQRQAAQQAQQARGARKEVHLLTVLIPSSFHTSELSSAALQPDASAVCSGISWSRVLQKGFIAEGFHRTLLMSIQEYCSCMHPP